MNTLGKQVIITRPKSIAMTKKTHTLGKQVIITRPRPMNLEMIKKMEKPMIKMNKKQLNNFDSNKEIDYETKQKKFNKQIQLHNDNIKQKNDLIYRTILNYDTKIIKALRPLRTTNKSKILLDFNANKNNGLTDLNEIRKLYNQDISEKNKKIRIKNIPILKNRKMISTINTKIKNGYRVLKQGEVKQYFRLTVSTEKTYTKKYYDKTDNTQHSIGESSINPVIMSPVYHDYIRNASNIANDTYNISDSFFNSVVTNVEITIMNTDLYNGSESSTHLMTSSFILRHDWLKYSHGISEDAYVNSDDQCVYFQLLKYVTHMDRSRKYTGRPNIRLNGKKLNSEEVIFDFLQNIIKKNTWSHKYPDFNIKSGVSSELIRELCKQLKRNMYAYDSESKIFDIYIEGDSKNYSPIIFYKLNGHMYLIDDKSVIRSVAESNKMEKKIISSTFHDEKKIDDVPKKVEKIDSFPLSSILELEEGVYLLQQSNLNKEVIKFISTYSYVPIIKTSGASIIQIKYEVGLIFNKKIENRKYVIIAVDQTFTELYNYENVKKIADKNNMSYTNEGLGSVIIKLLEVKSKGKRIQLNTDLIYKIKGKKCNVCNNNNPESIYHIDHIKPLSAGGNNEIKNLQVLCITCHKEKTKYEIEMDVYNNHDPVESTFNNIINKYVINTWAFKSWQFIESCSYNISELNEKYTSTPSQLTIQYNRNLDPNDTEKKISSVFKSISKPKPKPKPKNKKLEEKEEEKEEILNPKYIFKSDMVKCRRNITYHTKFEWPVYNVMDSVQNFSGKIQCGVYYIDSNNTYPLRGAGWYSQPTVQYCIDTRIITLEEIIFEFLPNSTLPCNHFQDTIDILLTSFEEEKCIQKTAVNAFIGLMGRTKQTESRLKYSLCEHEAANWYAENKTKDDIDVFITQTKLDDGKILYEGCFEKRVELESSKYLIYKQIVEMEAIELHKLEQIILRNKGIILDRNTDAIRYHSKREINLSDYYWDDLKTIQKFQAEIPKELQHESSKALCRPDSLDRDSFELDWDIQYDYTDITQKVNQILESCESIHINGRAGTGKTFFCNKIISELKSRNKKFLAFTPTNKSARLLLDCGKTMHSLLYKFQNNKKGLDKMLSDISYIFIDEVSMMGSLFYKLFTLIKRSFPKIKFIICGDFDQLLPVLDEYKKNDYKNSPALNNLCDGNRLELTICKRANSILFDLCKEVDTIKKEDFPVTRLTYKNIAYTHHTRIQINRECMARFANESSSQIFPIKSDINNLKTQDCLLTQNMPIICHKTNKKLKILNSELFTIINITEKSFFIINDDNEKIELLLSQFHSLFYPAFCVTVYACQGETYNSPYTIHDWNTKHFCNRAKYVAMSRSSKLEYIQIV